MDAARQALHDALLAHEPADDAERRDRDAIAALVAGTPRCFDRGFYTPGHVTGSAFVVDAGTGRVLLHHHRRLDRWLQLGGHDEGEHDPLQTALREAREESGLTDLTPLQTAILDIDVHEIPAGRSEPAAPAPRRALRPGDLDARGHRAGRRGVAGAAVVRRRPRPRAAWRSRAPTGRCGGSWR